MLLKADTHACVRKRIYVAIITMMFNNIIFLIAATTCRRHTLYYVYNCCCCYTRLACFGGEYIRENTVRDCAFPVTLSADEYIIGRYVSRGVTAFIAFNGEESETLL